MSEPTHEIDTKENKKHFLAQLEFQLLQMTDMDHHCFKDAGFYIEWKSENGQSGKADWYVGTGTTGPPPGGD